MRSAAGFLTHPRLSKLMQPGERALDHPSRQLSINTHADCVLTSIPLQLIKFYIASLGINGGSCPGKKNLLIVSDNDRMRRMIVNIVRGLAAQT